MLFSYSGQCIWQSSCTAPTPPPPAQAIRYDRSITAALLLHQWQRICAGLRCWRWAGEGGGWPAFGFLLFSSAIINCFDFLPQWLNQSVLSPAWKKQFVGKTNRRRGRISVSVCRLQMYGSQDKGLFLTSLYKTDTGCCLWHVVFVQSRYVCMDWQDTYTSHFIRRRTGVE